MCTRFNFVFLGFVIDLSRKNITYQNVSKSYPLMWSDWEAMLIEEFELTIDQGIPPGQLM